MRWIERSRDPGGDGWFNRGLEAKYALDWRESLRCNQRAAELDPKNEGAWWNLGIAATALHDWPEARRAWRRFGVELPDNPGEADALGSVACVRLNYESGEEVVWGVRLDPARMLLDSVPLPESGHRYRDVVLHDGAVSGRRTFDGEEVPVFDALAVWKASDYRVFQLLLDGALPDSLDSLGGICRERKLGFEDWSGMRWLCRECSRGNPGLGACEHRAPGQRSWVIAARSEEDVRAALAEWTARVPGASCSGLWPAGSK